jgi:hypothetical protein
LAPPPPGRSRSPRAGSGYAFTNALPSEEEEEEEEEEESREVYERSHLLPAPGGFVWGRMLANFTPGHQDTYTSTSTTTGVREEGRGPDKAPTPTGRPRRRHAAGVRYAAPYYTATTLELYWV